MKTASEIENALAYCTGTQGYTRHWSPRSLVYTDGIADMANMAEAHWLIDIVASLFADKKLVKIMVGDPDDGNLIVCELKTDLKNTTAVFTAAVMDEEPFYRQELSYTSFPMEEMVMWLSMERDQQVLYLPSEH